MRNQQITQVKRDSILSSLRIRQSVLLTWPLKTTRESPLLVLSDFCVKLLQKLRIFVNLEFVIVNNITYNAAIIFPGCNM